MEENNNKNTLILGGVLVILVIFGFLLYNFRSKPNVTETNKKADDRYILLDDYSRFFTVNSCVYKYIQYLQEEDFDNLLKVLDEKYINKNGINKSNIYNFLPNLSDSYYNFVSKKIYYKKISNSYISYYVYGYIIEDVMDSYGEKTYYEYVVNLDTKNETFNISSYDGDLFREEYK